MLLYLVDKKCKKEYADYHLRKFVETEDGILNGSGAFSSCAGSIWGHGAYPNNSQKLCF